MPLGMVLALAFFTLLLGYVIGNFLPILKNNPLSSKSGASSDSSTAEMQTVSPSQPDDRPSRDRATTPPGMLEVARMFRKGDTNQLVAQIDEKLVSSKDQLTNDQHALLSLLLLDLTDWVGIQTRLDVGERAPGRPSSESGGGEEERTGQSGFDPVGMFKKALQADVYLPFAEASLAKQINPILQELLENSPLSEKGIRLMDIEGRGMTVLIGLETFDSVDDIPDPLVQDLIKQAVSIWETRLGGKE